MMPESIAHRTLASTREARLTALQAQAEGVAARLGHRIYGSWFYPRALWLPVSVTFCERCHMCVVVDDGVNGELRLRGGAVKMRCMGRGA